jgi:hypothetical protein
MAVQEDATMAIVEDATVAVQEDATIAVQEDATMAVVEDTTMAVQEDATIAVSDSWLPVTSVFLGSSSNFFFTDTLTLPWIAISATSSCSFLLDSFVPPFPLLLFG